MKFLTLNSLTSATSLINETDTGDTIIIARIEAYTRKRAGTDKKLYKDLETQYKADPNLSLSVSPFGPMVDKRCRETLIELISTLNAAFPDYDFRSLRGENFIKVELTTVEKLIDERLVHKIPDYLKTKKIIWDSLELEIQPSECTIYSFVPDVGSDPFEEEGYLWSFNYFFYNKKKLKRIVLWTCTSHWKGNKSKLSEDVDFRDVDPDGDYSMDLIMNYDY